MKETISHPTHIQFVNLFERTHQEEQTLRETIADHNGSIRILVHPHFNVSKNYFFTQLRPKLAHYELGLHKLYAADNPQALPLFIFEVFEQMQQTRDTILSQYHSDSPKTITFVPTQADLPEPRLSLSDLNLYSDPNQPEKEAAHWQILRDTLQYLGVTDVLIEGQNMIFQHDNHFNKDARYTEIRKQLDEHGINKSKTLVPKQCVGITASELASICKVSFGALGFPHNRLDLKIVKPGQVSLETKIYLYFR